MNLAITQKGGVVSNDRRTWRYYLHLAGLRHETDQPILITSLDTQELIEFTKENLTIHKKTANTYRNNSDYVAQLILDNLDYAVYIKGVIRPVSLGYAVDAPDCSIFSYAASLVESQEQSLIATLEEKIRAFHVRYMADGWKVNNDAFVLAFYNMLYPMLPGLIIEARQQKQMTVETHSFYITEFLASHQELHEFIPYMTKKQLFGTYRNIRYWERNPGKKETFDWLIDLYLTGWGMPAVAYNVSQKIHDPSTGSDADLTPLPTAYKQALNFTEANSGRDLEIVDTSELITKELPLAAINRSYQDEYQTDLDRRLGLTQYPNLSTKLIEVTAIDPESMERWDYMHAMFNEWLHLTSRGQYDLRHEILNPTNGETLRLSSKELLILYLYAGFRGFSGVSLTDIPVFTANGVQVKRWMPPEEYRGLVMGESYAGRHERAVSYFVNSQHDLTGNILSSDDLYDHIEKLIKAKRDRYSFVHNRRKLQDRGAAMQMFNASYRNYKCDLKLPYRDYAEFFAVYNIDYKLVSDETWADLATDAFNLATNLENRATLSQGEIQRAMVKLLSKLSSYTVHFAARMTADGYDVTDPIVPILDDIALSGTGTLELVEQMVGVQDTAITGNARVDAILPCEVGIQKVVIPQTIALNFPYGLGISVSVIEKKSFDLTSDMVGVVEVKELTE
ncbi:MAG: hypothetical protein ACRDBQ_18755 [Shewanella sp.]